MARWGRWTCRERYERKRRNEREMKREMRIGNETKKWK